MSDGGDISRLRLPSLSLSLLYLLPSSTQLWRASSINKQGTVQSTLAIDNLYTTHQSWLQTKSTNFAILIENLYKLCNRHIRSLPTFAVDWDKFYQSLLQTEDRTIFPSFQCGSKVKVSIDNWELQWRDIINLLLVTGPGEMRVCWLLTPYQLYKQGWASWVVFRVYTHISMFWLVLTVFCLSDWLCLTHSLTVLELFAGRLMIFSQRDVTG